MVGGAREPVVECRDVIGAGTIVEVDCGPQLRGGECDGAPLLADLSERERCSGRRRGGVSFLGDGKGENLGEKLGWKGADGGCVGVRWRNEDGVTRCTVHPAGDAV